jgi:hypothetical protein
VVVTLVVVVLVLIFMTLVLPSITFLRWFSFFSSRIKE